MTHQATTKKAMAPITLLEVDAANVKIALGKASKGMNFNRVTIKGKPIQFTILPRGQFTQTPWRPSVYGGDGSEARVNIQFQTRRSSGC